MAIPKYEITYKSGRVIEINVKDLVVTFSTEEGNSHVKKMEWSGEMTPKHMFIGMDDIESIWRIK